MSDDFLKAVESLETVLQNDMNATDAYFKLSTEERVKVAVTLDCLMNIWFVRNHRVRP